MKPHLRVIDSETGEIAPSCPNCQALADEVAGLERENRAWRARYAELSREKEEDVTNHPLYGDALEVFKYWKAKCSHPRCRFDVKRFRLVLPFLKEYGMPSCRTAIDGAAFDPYVTKRRNGSEKRHDSIELIFRDKGRFEEFVNKAPRA